MPVTIESSRFGGIELVDEQLVEFPFGLIGIPGSRYALVNPHPGSVFRWLQSVEHSALALPVVDPRLLRLPFALALGAEERQRIGIEHLDEADVYATVRATADPTEATVNLRAPLVISEAKGYQVINMAPGASLRAPLVEGAHHEAGRTEVRLNRA